MTSAELFDILGKFQGSIVAIVVALIAYYFNREKKRLDESSLKRELFFRFNEKYDRLNEGLSRLVEREFEIDVRSNYDAAFLGGLERYWDEHVDGKPGALGSMLDPIKDYLNLCSEEYYWYKKGFVDQEVWDCWLAGMLAWHHNSFFLQRLVERERALGAKYYIAGFLDLFSASKKAA